MHVTSGIPQGSILGPYLYALTTATFSTESTHCHIVKYADDTTFCFPIFKDAPNNHIIVEHGNMLRWSASMDLSINTKKCQSLIIAKRMDCERIDLNGIQPAEKVKILGVWFDMKGGWKTHIDALTKISSRKLYAVRTLRPYLSNNELKQVYFAVVRSILEYCAPLLIGMSATEAKKVESIQRRFHRLLCGVECKDNNCVPLLSIRRRDISLRFLNEIMKAGHILNHHLPPISERSRFILPHRNTQRRCSSFMPYICEIYNLTVTR